MSFVVFTDGSANLPKKMADGVRILPCSYVANGEEIVYKGNIEDFDAHVFYEGLKNGDKIKTSLLNTQLFIDYFTPVLDGRQDIVYIAMAAGISGTYNAAKLAAEQLMENYPDRFIHIVDSKGCGFGSGILAIKAAQLSREGISCREAAGILDEAVPHACQYFTVDDLNFLKNTGRVSGVTASIGTILNIKPILFGDSTGHIISCSKVRGRKNAINAIAKKYAEKRMDDGDKIVCISHGDCYEDAELLSKMVKEINPDADITICQHEPFSGAHVGPGMLGLFFWGKER
ncbi:MAG: DegV family protein [Butyrivibrio sp.]|uniref:DegV family protein n=1 Tax=Butyrivibrio sp. TaxID=28121 RepID=UPI001B2BB079|nr:DegV family protein [Butyrivibrio sp.]MBO6241088.1 DegV family protein [Butyrivibrio sp.]